MAEKSKLWYLENFNLFKELDKAGKEHLEKITSMHEFPKSQPIYFPYEQSNSIFFLKKGRVKITRASPDGREMIVNLVNPGEVFGETAIVDENERTDHAVSLEDCLLCTISKEDFRDFINKNPDLNLKVTKLIGLKLRRYTERIEQLVFKDSQQRVISFLLNLANDNGKQIGDEIFVKPFLTHQDIAELTACSRQTVNSILSELRSRGLISFDRKKLIVHDKKALEKEA
jgi:CRP-like cAMP-binding protein